MIYYCYVSKAPEGCKEIYESSYGDYLFTSEFKKETCEYPFILTAKEPIISGRVLDYENTVRSVEDGEVQLRYAKEGRSLRDKTLRFPTIHTVPGTPDGKIGRAHV